MMARPTALERMMPLAGDAIVEGAVAQVMHAVTIAARPAAIWPWLTQMGSGRAGWYSYDWVDNGGTPSATVIRADLQQVAIGDIMPSLPGATTSFVVAAIEPLRDLVLMVPSASGSLLASWEFFLADTDADSRTRLLVRGRISALWPGCGGTPHYPIEWVYWLLARIPQWAILPAARFGHAVMQVRQLNGIKHRAERLHQERESEGVG